MSVANSPEIELFFPHLFQRKKLKVSPYIFTLETIVFQITGMELKRNSKVGIYII